MDDLLLLVYTSSKIVDRLKRFHNYGNITHAWNVFSTISYGFSFMNIHKLLRSCILNTRFFIQNYFDTISKKYVLYRKLMYLPIYTLKPCLTCNIGLHMLSYTLVICVSVYFQKMAISPAHFFLLLPSILFEIISLNFADLK